MRNLIGRSWLFALAGLLALAHSVQAGQQVPYVVLVGVSNYKDAAIKPRPHAEADVKALYDVLKDRNAFNCPTDHIKLLLGTKDDARKSEAATKENIIKALRWAFESAGAEDLIVLCWVGQGAPVGERTAYFAADSTLKDRVKDAVPAAELENLVNKTKSTRICVLLDVHFKGYDAGKEKVTENGLDKLLSEFNGRDEQDLDAVPKPVMFLSANDGLSAPIDVEKHGLFMHLVLEGLKGAADQEGNEADGHVTIKELFTYVWKELPRRAQLTAKKDQSARRTEHADSTPFVIHAPAAAKTKERLEKLAALAKENKIDEKVAKEGRELLEKMPRLSSQRQLRLKYQQLVDGKVEVDEFLKTRQAAIDGLKLSREDAEAFAKSVLKVANMAKNRYVKPTKLGTLAVAAVKGLYRKMEEKVPAEVNERLAKAEGLSEEDVRDLLADIREQIGNREDVRGQKAVDFALEAMLHSLDDYSTFIDAEKLAEFERMTKQSFIGVGIQIKEDPATEMIRVATPLYGSPAYKAGIKTGDLITKVTNTVDNKGNKLAEPEVTSTKGMKVTDAVQKILGQPGTSVLLTIQRDGVDKPLDFPITRGAVEVETVLGVRRNNDDSWDFYLDPANKLVYIRITQFAMNTERDLKKAMEKLQKTGINGLILDLRFNPGGYLDSAVGISDLFIEDGLIVSIRPGRGQEHHITGSSSRSDILGPPMVVLINGGSASASEIVSACFQDQKRAIIMGERSFGKGTVQEITRINLGNGESEIKLTTSSFWRPSGKNLIRSAKSKKTEDWGVQPDTNYAVELTYPERVELSKHFTDHSIIPRRDAPKKEAAPVFVDKQLNTALDYLRGKAATAKTAVRKAG